MDNVRVLSIALDPPVVEDNQLETNRETILAALYEAEKHNPDYVCLPEFILHYRVADERKSDRAEPVPGPSTDAVGDAARKLDAYVVLPMLRRAGERVHNSAVLVGPDGSVHGVYDKLRPTQSGLERGTAPGTETVVWETEHGRLSSIICFDIKFSEVGLRLGRRKPNLVFFPSMFPGGKRLASWTMEYGFFAVLATPTETAIRSPTGALLAENRDRPTIKPDASFPTDATRKYCMREINLDFKQYHRSMDGANQYKFNEVREEYGDSVVFHHARPEGSVILESRSSDVSVEDIEREMGLVDMQDYLDESRDACERRLEDVSPEIPP